MGRARFDGDAAARAAIGGDAVARSERDAPTRDVCRVRRARGNADGPRGHDGESLVVDDEREARGVGRVVAAGDGEVPPAKDGVRFDHHVAHDPVQVHERRGAREVKDRTAARRGKDLRDRHARRLRGAPRAVVDRGAGAAVREATALRQHRAARLLRDPKRTRRAVDRPNRITIRALQRREAVAAPRRGDAARAVRDFGPVRPVVAVHEVAARGGVSD